MSLTSVAERLTDAAPLGAPTTTLRHELDRMERTVQARLASFTAPRLPLVEGVVQILKSHSRVALSKEELGRIYEVVSVAVAEDRPVPIGFLWAVGGMARSVLKFAEWSMNYPRLGDIWGLRWLSAISWKVQQVYPPGLRIVIVDEVPLILMLGWSLPEVLRRQAMMRALAHSPVEIVSLPDYNGCEPRGEIGELSNEEIYSICTSIPAAISPAAIDQLYRQREKNWEEIQAMLPAGLWEEARDIRRRMNRVGLLRKEKGFLYEVFGGMPHIDGCITEKGRWSPKIWGMAFPQHGGSILDADDHQRYSVTVIPESRLRSTNTPVRVSTSDFDELVGESYRESHYTFYWK